MTAVEVHVDRRHFQVSQLVVRTDGNRMLLPDQRPSYKHQSVCSPHGGIQALVALETSSPLHFFKGAIRSSLIEHGVSPKLDIVNTLYKQASQQFMPALPATPTIPNLPPSGSSSVKGTPKGPVQLAIEKDRTRCRYLTGENSFEILVAKFNYINADNMLSNLTGWQAGSTKATLSAEFIQPTASVTGANGGPPAPFVAAKPAPASVEIQITTKSIRKMNRKQLLAFCDAKNLVLPPTDGKPRISLLRTNIISSPELQLYFSETEKAHALIVRKTRAANRSAGPTKKERYRLLRRKSKDCMIDDTAAVSLNSLKLKKQNHKLTTLQEWIAFLCMHHSMIENQGTVCSIALDFGVDEQTMGRIHDTFCMALSFFFKYQQSMPTYDEILNGTSADIASSCRLKAALAAIFIGDCTERWTQSPRRSELFNFLWSHYKKHCTIKFLMAVLSCGFTCHCSVFAPASDDAVIEASGIALKIGQVQNRSGRDICFMYDRGICELEGFMAQKVFVHTPPKAEPHQKLFGKESTEHSKKQSPGRIAVEHANKLYWENAAASKEVVLARMDMVEHEMKTTVGLCNLKPCHSIKAQATSHATIKLPQAHRGEILIAGPTCLVNGAEAVPAPEKEVEMLPACRNIGNPFHTCSQFCYEYAKAANSCATPIVEVPVVPVAKRTAEERRRIAVHLKAIFLLQHPPTLPQPGIPQPGIIVAVDQLPNVPPVPPALVPASPHPMDVTVASPGTQTPPPPTFRPLACIG